MQNRGNLAPFGDAFAAKLGEAGPSQLSPLSGFRQMAEVFAGEPAAQGLRGSRLTGYVSRRMSEESGPKRPFPWSRGPQYGVGTRETERYVTSAMQQRGQKKGPGDPVYERIKAGAEKSRRSQLGLDVTDQLHKDLMQDGGYVSIKGYFTASDGNDERYRPIGPVFLDGDAWETVLYAWENGDVEEAERLFVEEWADAYGIPRKAHVVWDEMEIEL